jgi:hypothetical protein
LTPLLPDGSSHILYGFTEPSILMFGQVYHGHPVLGKTYVLHRPFQDRGPAGGDLATVMVGAVLQQAPYDKNAFRSLTEAAQHLPMLDGTGAGDLPYDDIVQTSVLQSG